MPSAEWAERMTAAYVEDTDRLGIGRPDAEPLATETIASIVALISDLVEGGHAYEAGGDVYFRVKSFDGYGKLSNRDTEDMDQGEEAGTASLKEDPLDFALWKAAKEGEDASWPSPWGEGRPGWHIECSAMAEAELGLDFDDPRRRIRPGLPAPRERDRADRGRPRGAARPHLDAQRDGPARQGEDVEVGGQHLPALRGDRPLRRPRPSWPSSPPATTASRSPSPTSCWRSRRRASQRIRNYAQGRARAASPTRSSAERTEAFLDALADDFNTPRAFAALAEIVAEGNRRELAGRPRRARGPAAAARARLAARRARRGPTPRPRRCSPSARRRARPRTSTAPMRSATSSRRSAGRSATRPEGARLVRKA